MTNEIIKSLHECMAGSKMVDHQATECPCGDSDWECDMLWALPQTVGSGGLAGCVGDAVGAGELWCLNVADMWN